MQDISQELLSRVLSLLETTDDLARFSAVSKGWAAAAAEARPTRLRIYRSRRDYAPNNDAVNELRWLQTWQRQQRFQKIQDFVMEEDAPPEQATPHTTFAQNMVTYAGLWNLQKCDLAGSFCLFSAVGTLPTTLQSLSLHPVCGPPELFSSAFQRFKQLESLSLSYTWEEEDGQCYCSFTLDCILNNLYTLDLLKSPDIICSCVPQSQHWGMFAEGDQVQSKG